MKKQLMAMQWFMLGTNLKRVDIYARHLAWTENLTRLFLTHLPR